MNNDCCHRISHNYLYIGTRLLWDTQLPVEIFIKHATIEAFWFII